MASNLFGKALMVPTENCYVCVKKPKIRSTQILPFDIFCGTTILSAVYEVMHHSFQIFHILSNIIVNMNISIVSLSGINSHLRLMDNYIKYLFNEDLNSFLSSEENYYKV